MNIYVVRGQTGEYSDQNEWPVKAFNSEDKAKEYVLLCDHYAKISESKKSDRYDDCELKNPYDPNMEMDYTGTFYKYEVVDLEE